MGNRVSQLLYYIPFDAAAMQKTKEKDEYLFYDVNHNKNLFRSTFMRKKLFKGREFEMRGKKSLCMNFGAKSRLAQFELTCVHATCVHTSWSKP